MPNNKKMTKREEKALDNENMGSRAQRRAAISGRGSKTIIRAPAKPSGKTWGSFHNG